MIYYISNNSSPSILHYTSGLSLIALGLHPQLFDLVLFLRSCEPSIILRREMAEYPVVIQRKSLQLNTILLRKVYMFRGEGMSKQRIH